MLDQTLIDLENMCGEHSIELYIHLHLRGLVEKVIESPSFVGDLDILGLFEHAERNEDPIDIIGSTFPELIIKELLIGTNLISPYFLEKIRNMVSVSKASQYHGFDYLVINSDIAFMGDIDIDYLLSSGIVYNGLNLLSHVNDTPIIDLDEDVDHSIELIHVILDEVLAVDDANDADYNIHMLSKKSDIIKFLENNRDGYPKLIRSIYDKISVNE